MASTNDVPGIEVPGSKSEATRLFLDYNFYRAQTAHVQQKRDSGQFTRSFKITQERLDLFQRLIAWCRERNVDPRLWLYHLFRSRNWMFPPTIKLPAAEGHLMSEKMLSRYHKFLERDRLDGYTTMRDEERAGKEKASRYDPNVDILLSVEQKKARFIQQGRADRCMSDMIDSTFGYHPNSQVCATCPIDAACLERLQNLVDFDIVALRNGDITPETAKLQVRMKQQQFQTEPAPTGITKASWGAE